MMDVHERVRKQASDLSRKNEEIIQLKARLLEIQGAFNRLKEEFDRLLIASAKLKAAMTEAASNHTDLNTYL